MIALFRIIRIGWPCFWTAKAAMILGIPVITAEFYVEEVF
jgi:hypothetical protein